MTLCSWETRNDTGQFGFRSNHCTKKINNDKNESAQFADRTKNASPRISSGPHQANDAQSDTKQPYQSYRRGCFAINHVLERVTDAECDGIESRSVV